MLNLSESYGDPYGKSNIIMTSQRSEKWTKSL